MFKVIFFNPYYPGGWKWGGWGGFIANFVKKFKIFLKIQKTLKALKSKTYFDNSLKLLKNINLIC